MLRVKKGSGALATIAAMTGWLNAPCEEGVGHQVVARNGYQWQEMAIVHSRRALGRQKGVFMARYR